MDTVTTTERRAGLRSLVGAGAAGSWSAARISHGLFPLPRWFTGPVPALPPRVRSAEAGQGGSGGP